MYSFVINLLKSWLGGPKHQNLRQILRFKSGLIATLINFFRKVSLFAPAALLKAFGFTAKLCCSLSPNLSSYLVLFGQQKNINKHYWSVYGRNTLHEGLFAFIYGELR